jgi:hypothetical protein
VDDAAKAAMIARSNKDRLNNVNNFKKTNVKRKGSIRKAANFIKKFPGANFALKQFKNIKQTWGEMREGGLNPKKYFQANVKYWKKTFDNLVETSRETPAGTFFSKQSENVGQTLGEIKKGGLNPKNILKTSGNYVVRTFDNLGKAFRQTPTGHIFAETPAGKLIAKTWKDFKQNRNVDNNTPIKQVKVQPQKPLTEIPKLEVNKGGKNSVHSANNILQPPQNKSTEIKSVQQHLSDTSNRQFNKKRGHSVTEMAQKNKNLFSDSVKTSPGTINPSISSANKMSTVDVNQR